LSCSVNNGAKDKGQFGAVFSRFWIVKLTHSGAMPPLSRKEKLSGQQALSAEATKIKQIQRLIPLIEIL
jgi:hypothetical protein